MEFNWTYFNEVPVIGILRGIPMADIVHILPLCISAGLRTIEITMNSVDVKESIAYAIDSFEGQLNLGVGTVCSKEDLEKALSYGASFIVTPNLDEEVIRLCVNKEIPVFTGAFTPSEIYKAWKLGASMVKVFPVDNLGPSYIKNVLAPFENIKLLPTGGIDSSNVQDYFKAGACGVGVSGGLFNKQMILEKKWDALQYHIRKLVSTVK